MNAKTQLACIIAFHQQKLRQYRKQARQLQAKQALHRPQQPPAKRVVPYKRYTRQQKQQVYRLRKQGLAYETIGRLYGMSFATVYKYANAIYD